MSKKEWATWNTPEGWVVVYPLNDIKQHDLHIQFPTGDPNTGVMVQCECYPKIELGNKVIIHGSFDLREIQEFVNEN